MRGEHHEVLVHGVLVYGIIPACAGSTEIGNHTYQGKTGSSPHARGAQLIGHLAALVIGDHPRMRGEHLHPHNTGAVGVGIIPACAGSTTMP